MSHIKVTQIHAKIEFQKTKEALKNVIAERDLLQRALEQRGIKVVEVPRTLIIYKDAMPEITLIDDFNQSMSKPAKLPTQKYLVRPENKINKHFKKKLKRLADYHSATKKT